MIRFSSSQIPSLPAAYRGKSILASGMVAAVSLILGGAGFGQSSDNSQPASSPDFRSSPPALPDSEPISHFPRDAYRDEPAVGVPEQALFRTTRAVPLPNPNSFVPAPSFQGGNVRDQIRIEAPTFNGGFPLLQKGFAPQDADLKIGPVYFKLNALSGALLVSDNIDLTENDRKSGVIGIVRISGTVIAQLTEDLRFVAAGSLGYLPFKNEFGFGGTASRIPSSFGLAAVSAVHSQLGWDVNVAGWPVLIADDFRSGFGSYYASTRDDFSFFDGRGPAGEDRAGRYNFRLPSQSTGGRDQSTRDSQSDFTYFSNTASISTDRYLPNDLHLHIRAYNENLWYNQGNRGLPTLRDGGQVLLKDEDPNLRFQPFFEYRTLYTTVANAFNHQARLGIEGPITDQLHFLGSVGANYFSQTGSTNLIFNVDLQHQASPYLREALYAGRDISEFGDLLVTYVGVNAHQILGPKLALSVFVDYETLEDQLGVYSTTNDLRTGLRLEVHAGPRTQIELSGIFAKTLHDPTDDANETTWTGRFDMVHQFSETIYSHLIYQYQVRDSNHEDRSYYENLVFLSLTKYFR